MLKETPMPTGFSNVNFVFKFNYGGFLSRKINGKIRGSTGSPRDFEFKIQLSCSQDVSKLIIAC